MGPSLFVVVDNADDAEAILSSPHCINKEDSYQYVREGIQYDGLFTVNGVCVCMQNKINKLTTKKMS